MTDIVEDAFRVLAGQQLLEICLVAALSAPALSATTQVSP